VARVGVEAKPIWLLAKKDQCDACGYLVIEKTKYW